MKLSEIAFYVEERVNSDTISLEKYVTNVSSMNIL